MAGIEHQVLKLVAFVHEQVVDTHHLGIHGIVLTLCNAILYILQLGFKRLLALLQPFEHTTGSLRTLFAQDFKVLFHGVHFFLQYSFLYLQSLRYHAKLLMCKYDAVPVVVLDIIEDALSVLLAEIIVNGTCGLALESVLAFTILSVIDHKISKGNNTCYEVVLVLVFYLSNGFKRFVPNEDVAFAVGM